MSPFDSVDLYCERTHPGMWAEPANVLTNLAFFLVAWMLWRNRFSSGSPQVHREQRALALLIAFIGISSGLFHLFGKVWGNWLDVGSIALFVVTYIHRYLRRLAGLSKGLCWFGVVVFAIANMGVDALGTFGLNGSEAYLPPGGTLMIFAWWSRRVAPRAAGWLFAAACIFALSLTLRTLDKLVCADWPIGTHFLWHILNALVLYCCVRALAQKDSDLAQE